MSFCDKMTSQPSYLLELILYTFQIPSIISIKIKRIIAISFKAIARRIPFKNQKLRTITVNSKNGTMISCRNAVIFNSYHQNNHIIRHIDIICIIIISNINIFQRGILIIIPIQTIVRIYTHGIQIIFFRQSLKCIRIKNRSISHPMGRKHIIQSDNPS